MTDPLKTDAPANPETEYKVERPKPKMTRPQKIGIDRLAIMVMAAGLGMRFEEVKRYCEGAVDLVVQLERRGGIRGVAEVWLPFTKAPDPCPD